MKNNKEEKELIFMLYNYPNINRLIEERKRELLDEVNTSSDAWRKSKTSVIGYTLEDVFERIEDDYRINRLKDWNLVFEKYLIDISGNDLLYDFFYSKYIGKKTSREIMSKLHINADEYLNLDSKLKSSIYNLCKKEKIFAN